MKLTLTEAEVKRAIQHYVAEKTFGVKPDDLTVKVQWYAKSAVVNVPAVPVLNVDVKEPQ
jgi:hypothetical protein